MFRESLGALLNVEWKAKRIWRGAGDSNLLEDNPEGYKLALSLFAFNSTQLSSTLK